MPAEGAGGDFEQADGDFDDGNDTDDEPVLDEDEDGEPWVVLDEMSERRRAGLERYRAARVAAAARRAGECTDPFAAVHVGYLAELFGSARFAALWTHHRATLCSSMHYITTRST